MRRLGKVLQEQYGEKVYKLSPAFGGASQGARSADSPKAVHIVRSPRRAAKRVSAPTKLRGFPPGAVEILRRFHLLRMTWAPSRKNLSVFS